MIYVMNKYDINQKVYCQDQRELGKHFSVEQKGDMKEEVDHSQHHLNTPTTPNVSVFMYVCNVFYDLCNEQI